MASRRAGARPSSETRSRSGASGQRPAFLSDGAKGTRLQKFLANAGIDSRRNCEELIRTGRVTVDGEVISNPAVSVHPDEQDVRLDGERLRLPKFRYFLVNKPKGVVCTNRDPAGRPLAVDLVPDTGQKLFTVGRLDENTHGLLLITNDGALAEHLAHPRYQVIRRYRVQVAGLPTPEVFAELKKGMHFSDGFFRFHSIRNLKRKGRSAFVELELREGKNREIRRMMARAGHKVIDLQRVAFGPLKIGRLAAGECRELRSAELRDLYDFIRTAPHIRNEPRRRPKSSAPRKKKPRKRSAEPQPEAKSGSRRGAARYGQQKKTAAKRPAGGRGKKKTRRR